MGFRESNFGSGNAIGRGERGEAKGEGPSGSGFLRRRLSSEKG